MTRFAWPILAFIALVVFLGVGLTKDPRKLPSPYLNNPAPIFELPSLTKPDGQVSSADFAGQMVLINVWATWCVGCRQEHEFLMRLRDVQPLPIYGINWRDNRQDALIWLQQLGDPYVDSAFDEQNRVGIDFGVYGAPETFLVDAEGIVRHRHAGPLNSAIWERDFVPLINQLGSGS